MREVYCNNVGKLMLGPPKLPVNVLAAIAGLHSNGEWTLTGQLNLPGLPLHLLSVVTVDLLHDEGLLRLYLTCNKDGMLPDLHFTERFKRGVLAEGLGNWRCARRERGSGGEGNGAAKAARTLNPNPP